MKQVKGAQIGFGDPGGGGLGGGNSTPGFDLASYLRQFYGGQNGQQGSPSQQISGYFSGGQRPAFGNEQDAHQSAMGDAQNYANFWGNYSQDRDNPAYGRMMNRWGGY